jgi:hypothetical protein
LNVPPSYKGKISNITYTSDPKKYGIVIDDKGLNNFFTIYGIPLTEEYIPISKIDEFSFDDILKKNLIANNSLIVGFTYNAIYTDSLSMSGHVSLILSIENRNAVLLDPGPRNAGEQKVMLDDLYAAIKSAHNGIWIIKNKPHE